jgi:rubrerythrin
VDKTTKIKFIQEISVELLDEQIYEDEKITSFTVFECGNCHWRFIGDCARYGYGYTSEGTQAPNYCPMCGRKIKDELEECRDGGDGNVYGQGQSGRRS